MEKVFPLAQRQKLVCCGACARALLEQSPAFGLLHNKLPLIAIN